MSLEFKVSSISHEEMPGVAAGVRSYVRDPSGFARLFPSNTLSWSELVSKRAALLPKLSRDLAVRISEQQSQWGAGKRSVANALDLYEEEIYCVVTGQQPGLVLGPLYTLFKILTTVGLAQEIERQVPEAKVVPIFWNASVDSDLSEIQPLCLIDRDGQPKSFQVDLTGLAEGTMISAIPSGRVVFSELEQWIKDQCFETDFLNDCLAMLRKTRSESTRLSEWFNRLLHKMLPDSGLVIIETALLETKSVSAPLWASYLCEPGLLYELLQESNSSLCSLGIEPRVTKRLEDSGWFLVQGGTRYPIRFKERELTVGSTRLDPTKVFSGADCELKPSAALRPILQDYLLPNLATVVGPHEFEYHAQLQSMYEYHNVLRPKVLLRFSGAIIESKVEKFLDEAGLSPHDLARPLRELEKRLFKEREGRGLSEWVQAAKEYLLERFAALGSDIEALGSDLASPVEKKQQRILQELDSLEDLLVRRASQRNEIIGNRLLRARSLLFPDDQWQERSLSPLYFLIKYGPEFLETLQRAIAESSSDEEYRFLTIQR